jgi:hypothetical protein
MSSVSEDRQAAFSPGLAIKQACRLASTANIAFAAGAPNGLSVVDGVQTIEGDRVLLKNPVDQTQNGIWSASSGAWTRTPDFDGIRDVAGGTLTMILAGSQAQQLFAVMTTGTITPGTTAIAFAVLTSSGILLNPATQGELLFGGPPNSIAQDAALFWDNTNKRLGVGNAAPTVALDVTGTVKASTSVQSQFYDTSGSAGAIGAQGNIYWRIHSGQVGNFKPANDNTQFMGDPAFRIQAVFTPIVDSGTTGSLSLDTNNGTTQLEVLHVASANDRITIAGASGGANPTLAVKLASLLAITPSVVIAGNSLQVGPNPSGQSGVNTAYNTGYSSRNNAGSSDLTLIKNTTINSVPDIVSIAGAAGGVFTARSGAGAPTTSDIAAGKYAVWRDTSGATTKLYYNNAGSIQSVALT